MVIRPTHLRFNENLSLKEDYDYTVQHIKEYGGVVRCFQILAQWKHYTNEGGAVAYRTDEEDKRNIILLRELHPGWFAGHKTGSKVQVTLRAPAKYRLGCQVVKKAQIEGSTSGSTELNAAVAGGLLPSSEVLEKSGLRRSKRKRSSHTEDSGIGI